MVPNCGVHNAVRGTSWGLSWRHRPGSVCRCPFAALPAFIPVPIPRCQAAQAAVNQSECKRGPKHCGATSKDQCCEKLRARCWHTTASHRATHRKGVRVGKKCFFFLLFAPTVQNSILPVSHPTIKQGFSFTFFSFLPHPFKHLLLPRAKAFLECVNKRDNLIKKIQYSSLENKVRFAWAQYGSHPLPHFYCQYQSNLKLSLLKI